MLNVTEEQKQMFYSDKYSYNYIFRFPEIGLEFDNEQIHSEEVTVKESICDEEDLVLGGCIASSIAFTVSEIMADEISGLAFTAEIAVKDEVGDVVQTVPMGTYIVDNPEQTNNKDRKSVTAYDRMYEISVDVSDWYNTFFADGTKHTVKETRESLLTHLGIPFVVQTLPNDDVLVEKTVEPNGSLPGTAVLKCICEINGAFGRMNRYGRFEEIYLHGLGVFPEDSKDEAENIYPDETLYPEDGFEYFGLTDEDEFPEYRDVTYSEYMTHPITSITIQSDEEDVGVTVGDDTSNPYVITSNILLYGKSSEEITPIGENILKKIKGLQYRPNTTELDGLPYMECGDSFVVEIEGNIVESMVFSRTLKGIQALIDTFESKGNKVRANEVSQSEEIRQLKGKTLKITKQLDNFAVVLKNLEDGTESVLNMASSNILLQVTKDGKVAAITLDGEEEADSVKIDLSAAHITINADKWNVNEDGEMECSAITIDGGKIDIETGYDDDDKISLKFTDDLGEEDFNVVFKYRVDLMDRYGTGSQSFQRVDVADITSYEKTVNETWEHGDYEINHYGYEEPGHLVDADVGETFLDKSTGKLYMKYIIPEQPSETMWRMIYQCSLLEYEDLESSIIWNEEGMHCTKTMLSRHQEGTETYDGEMLLEDLNKDSEDALAPVQLGLRSTLPVLMPNMQAGRTSIKPSGANVPTSVHVDFETEFAMPPCVTVTPVTVAPGTKVTGVSIQNVDTSGFDIYLTRTDTTTTGLHWIAIYAG